MMFVVNRNWLFALIVYFALAFDKCSQCSEIYHVSLQSHPYALPYKWAQVNVQIKNAIAHANIRKKQAPHYVSLNSSHMVSQPVYVSLATISSRVLHLHKVVRAYTSGLIVPTQLFVFISEFPFLLDEGVPICTLPDELLAYVVEGMVTLVYTDNIGSHRKLLPILKRYKQEDVLIATVDDDLVSKTQSTVLYQLLHEYIQSNGTAVVSLRPRRVGLCQDDPMLTTQYQYWKLVNTPGVREMLLVPTGTGGVLYRPHFFHEVIFSKELWAHSATTDDISFRLATMINNISVTVGCRPLEYRNRIVRPCPIDTTTMTHIFPLMIEKYRVQYPKRRLPNGFNLTQKLLHNIYGKNFDSPSRFLVNIISNAETTHLSACQHNTTAATTTTDTTIRCSSGSSNSCSNRLSSASGQSGSHKVQCERQLQTSATALSSLNNNPTTTNTSTTTVQLQSTLQPPNSFGRNAKVDSLFQNNSRGGNIFRWRTSIQYLAQRGLFSVHTLLAETHRERPKECYERVSNTTSNDSGSSSGSALLVEERDDDCAVYVCANKKLFSHGYPKLPTTDSSTSSSSSSDGRRIQHQLRQEH